MKGKIKKKINKKESKETTKSKIQKIKQITNNSDDRMLWKDWKNEEMELKELRKRKELRRRLLEERRFLCIEDKQKLKKR